MALVLLSAMISRYISCLRVGCLDPFRDVCSYFVKTNDCIRHIIKSSGHEGVSP